MNIWNHLAQENIYYRQSVRTSKQRIVSQKEVHQDQELQMIRQSGPLKHPFQSLWITTTVRWSLVTIQIITWNNIRIQMIFRWFQELISLNRLKKMKASFKLRKDSKWDEVQAHLEIAMKSRRSHPRISEIGRKTKKKRRS